MAIEKYIEKGWWKACTIYKGKYMVRIKENKMEALNSLFEDLYWLNNLERPKVDWFKVKDQGGNNYPEGYAAV